MSGIKVSELPLLGATPAPDDLMYVVDVSDTSESTEGTSKAVEYNDVVNFSRSVVAGTLNASSATINGVINKIGGTISINYTSNWVFTIERTGGEPLTGIAVINFNNGTQDNETAIPVFLVYGSTYLSFGDAIQVKFIDNTSPSVDGIVPFSFTIDYYPNGFDA